ncbi:hypothetical protein D9M71_831620 [compost metagenome]
MQLRYRPAERLALILVNSSEQRFCFKAEPLNFFRRLGLLRIVVSAQCLHCTFHQRLACLNFFAQAQPFPVITILAHKPTASDNFVSAV